MIIYLDTEFTSLTQDAKLISVALVDINGRSLYIEVKDCPIAQDEWLQKNVYANLKWRTEDPEQFYFQNEVDSVGYLPLEEVAEYIQLWLLSYKEGIYIWGDCIVWDWMLFCELFGGAQKIPKNIFYLPFDLVTLLATKGINPDKNRQELLKDLDGEITSPDEVKLHNALFDAKQTKAIAEALTGAKH